MTQSLTERQKEILINIFIDRACFWIEAIENQLLAYDQIEKACDILSGEFHMKGIDKNFEANDYGKEIEALIDIVNRPRLTR